MVGFDHCLAEGNSAARRSPWYTAAGYTYHSLPLDPSARNPLFCNRAFLRACGLRPEAKGRNMSMPRCSFRHKAFAKSNAFGADGSDQCWIDEVGNFGTLDLPDFRCLLHAPPDILPIDRSDWPIDGRGRLQSETLLSLLDDWFNTAPICSVAFCMPGLQCGPIDFTERIFAADVFCPEASFNGNAIFKDALFSGSLDFESARFSGRAGFADTAFGGNVTFSNVTFGGETEFMRATFNKYSGYTEFRGAVFRGNAWFSKAVFHSGARFLSASFHQEANFDESRFDGDAKAWFTGAHFERFANFYSTSFGNDTGFNNASFKGRATFESAIFQGTAYFEYATFEAHVEFYASIFRLGFKLWHCHFAHPTQLTKCGVCMFLYSVHTGEQIDFNQCYIVDRDPINSNLEFVPTYSDGAWNFIDGVWNFADQSCARLGFLNMDLTNMNFLGADVRETVFDACIWRGKSKYAKVYGHDKSMSKGDLPDVRQLWSLYRQLKRNMEADHNYRDAGDFHYREMEVWQYLMRGRLFSLDRMVLWIYGLVADYGQSYRKVFAFILIAIFVTSCVVGVNEGLVHDDTPMRIVLSVPDYFQRVFLALIPSTFQRHDLDLAGLHFGSKVAIVLGGLSLLVLAALFVMAIRRRFRR